MKRSKITCLLMLFCSIAFAQSEFSGEEQQVYQVIEKLFDGMRAGDSSMVHSVFTNNPQMYTATINQQGEPVLHKGELQQFLNAVGGPHEQVFDEPIWNTDIKIDGLLAQVWTDYAFYLGKNFSHCGVDAFHLFKTDEGWKIFHLTDTRKREGCEVPEEVKESRK